MGTCFPRPPTGSWCAVLFASALAVCGVAAPASHPQDGHPQDGAPAPGGERPADARALFAAFARMPGLEASFTEEKWLALLELPLKSSGTLYFLPPGFLTRVVAAPQESTLTITPDELRMADREGVEVLDLRSNAEVRAFVTSLLRVFSGDFAGLERSYAIVYEPSPADDAHWSLGLTPRAKPLSDMLGSLHLHGERLRVERIELHEKNGDRTVTTIVRADPERRFSAEERQRLFGLDAKRAPETPARRGD